jgi:hypothetical protein
MMTITIIMLLSICLEAPPFFSREENLSRALAWQEQYEAQKKREQRIDNILLAIRTIESQGNYEAVGWSGEYGAYQWMPESFAQFSYRYFGELLDITLPENQDKVARKKVEELIDKGYTEEQIASIWNSGRPSYEGRIGVNKFGVRYNVPRYVNKFIAVLNQIETT